MRRTTTDRQLMVQRGVTLHSVNSKVVIPRFGPGGAWLLVLIPDLVLSGLVALALFVGSTHNQLDPDEPGPVLPQPPDALLIGPGIVLAATLVGTWCAVLRPSNHPQTVSAGRAVAVLRLALVVLLFAM